jgi:uncharacterized protein
MRKFYILVCIISVFASSAFSEEFKPWNSDVAIADENFIVRRRYNPQTMNVYSAPAAGAFFMIRGFQIFISPQDGPNCRFSPTCSEYGKIAVLKYGALMGAFLAGDRLLRCNPYNPHGHDPVPESLFK